MIINFSSIKKKTFRAVNLVLFIKFIINSFYILNSLNSYIYNVWDVIAVNLNVNHSCKLLYSKRLSQTPHQLKYIFCND